MKIKLAISVLACLLVGFIGSIFTMPAISGWYGGLSKPFFSPPNWVFGPVWTILYLLMAISFFLVWTKKGDGIKVEIAIFAVQLALNLLWSIIFFGLKSPGLALIEIMLLWLVILVTIVKFQKVSKLAGYLLIPYLFWVAFASILNFAIFRLN